MVPTKLKDPELLANLYWKEKKSLKEISEIFGVHQETARRWMKRHKIPRRDHSECKRPWMKLRATACELHRLYWIEKKSLNQMAKLFRVSASVVRNRMKRYNIARRSISEAKMKYPRKPFSGCEVEKNYLIRLRADIHACRSRRSIQVSTATSHPSMIDLFFRVFSKYGHCGKIAVKDACGYKYNIYSFLDESFSFLLDNPPQIILKSRESFYSLLAGYNDTDGDWRLHRSRKYISVSFRLRMGDCELMKQIKEQLEKEGYHPNFGLQKPTGWAKKDIYVVHVDRRKEVEDLAQKILPYSKHKEKIEKMKLILKAKGKKYWTEIKDEVLEFREKIKKEVNECVKRAEEEYKRKRREN